VKLIRQDLVNAVRAGAGLTDRQSDEVVAVIFDAMAQALRRGEQVHTPVGSFVPAREGSTTITKVLSGMSRSRVFRLVYRRRSIRFLPASWLGQ
jgi:hypothetical protein